MRGNIPELEHSRVETKFKQSSGDFCCVELSFGFCKSYDGLAEIGMWIF